jgi:hypothetical protein
MIMGGKFDGNIVRIPPFPHPSKQPCPEGWLLMKLVTNPVLDPMAATMSSFKGNGSWIMRNESWIRENFFNSTTFTREPIEKFWIDIIHHIIEPQNLE